MKVDNYADIYNLAIPGRYQIAQALYCCIICSVRFEQPKTRPQILLCDI